MSLRKRTIRQLSSGLAKRLAKLYNESDRHTKQLKALLLEIEESESEHRALKRQVAHLSEAKVRTGAAVDPKYSTGLEIEPAAVLGLVTREERSRRNHCEVTGHKSERATHKVWMMTFSTPGYYYKVCHEHHDMAHKDRQGGMLEEGE